MNKINVFKSLVSNSIKNIKNPLKFVMGFIFIRYFNVNVINKITFKNNIIMNLTCLADYYTIVEYMNNYYDIQHTKNVDILVDIGANCGDYSIFMHNKAKQVYAFEPVDSIYQRMIKNIKDNAIKNIEVVRCGVGEANGQLKIYVPIQDGGSSTIESRGTELDSLGLNCRTEEIDIITFDDVYSYLGSPEVIDLIKIDCEGGEYGLLNSKKLINHIEDIRLELHVFDKSLIIKAHKLINYLHKNKFLITNMSRRKAEDKINNCKCFEIYFRKVH